ncbi:SubName: Full=Uncharacterized protein {ECO:0000313/EMBL:CCA69268.1} [Serendipita indica DSM 11827]|nr:SubName: Full=Uncharacterized protein {ECO:0000313/EMBL:CCA69268.1} [Serendipita indica DSM 11827]
MKSSWTLLLVCWSLRLGNLALASGASTHVVIDDEDSYVPITRTSKSDEYDYNKNNSPHPTSLAIELLYPYFADTNGAKPLGLPNLNPGVEADDIRQLPRGKLLDTRQSGHVVPWGIPSPLPAAAGMEKLAVVLGVVMQGRRAVAWAVATPERHAVEALSTASVLSRQSVASVSSLSADASSYSSSLSRDLASQTRPPGADTTTVATVIVKPNDSRIKYQPSTAWIGTSSSSPTGSTGQSPIGTCTNGTKATREVGAKMSFVFEGAKFPRAIASTSIALLIIPSSRGGAFSVQIDNEQPVTISSSTSGAGSGGGDGAVTITNSNGGVIVGGGIASILGLTSSTTAAAATSSGSSSNDQCIESQVYARDNLSEAPHQIVVVNGVGGVGTVAGVLELSGIKYTGKGAFGTDQPGQGESGGGGGSNNAAVIGGSIGGVLGAIALVAIGAVVMYRRKRRNSQPTTPATMTTGVLGTPGRIHGGGALGLVGSPSMQQHQPLPSGPTTPYTIPWRGGGGVATTAAGYYGHGRTMSNTSGNNASTSPPSNVAPLPMWVERAVRPNTDATSSSGEASPPPAPTTARSTPGIAGVGAGHPQNTANPFYGSHYPANASGANTGYM